MGIYAYFNRFFEIYSLEVDVAGIIGITLLVLRQSCSQLESSMLSFLLSSFCTRSTCCLNCHTSTISGNTCFPKREILLGNANCAIVVMRVI